MYIGRGGLPQYGNITFKSLFFKRYYPMKINISLKKTSVRISSGVDCGLGKLAGIL